MNIYDALLNHFRNKAFPLFRIICHVLPLAGFGINIYDNTPWACPKAEYANTAWCQCEYYNNPAACTKETMRGDDADLATLPTRLSFATFASQNGYLASAQVVTDHLYQKQFAPQKQTGPGVTAMNFSEQDLMADASDKEKTSNKACQPTLCKKEGFLTGWLSAFGEYAHEKPRQTVAAFSFDVGGAVVGIDYNCVNDDVIGIGGSYVYTHVEDGAGAGHANVNQGFLGIYGTLHAEKWHFDLGVWSGYYHTNNVRNNPFITKSILRTVSKTHGWQAAPHIEVGYDGFFSNVCQVKWFGVGPFALADWVATWEHGFSEHGAFGFDVHQKGKFCSLLRAETGLRFHEIVKFGWGHLVFIEKGSYTYQKMFGTGTVTASFVGNPGSHTFSTLKGAQNLGVVEFSISLMPLARNMPHVDFRYQGEFGSKYQSHQGIFEIGKDF
jgi:uncharacterized protein with beta-barrel porin domain